MRKITNHYINGQWVQSEGGTSYQVINPATEEACSEITLGSQADVDRAVAAAKAVFASYSVTSREERLALLGKVIEVYKTRIDDIAEAISMEMGCPISIAKAAQAMTGVGHLATALGALQEFDFTQANGDNSVVHEPIGVVAMITPWNWPINQIAAKVAPCLAAGCTMVLKPSEEAPLSAVIFAEVLHEAGVPAGVFNLVQGDGPGAGSALSGHADVDMVSFTGSTRAGIMVAKNAADTVKRVSQELGGKSPNIILEEADLEAAVTGGLKGVLLNSGQSCVAPTRLLVPEALHDKAVEIAVELANATPVGDPTEEGGHIGPVVNRSQWEKIQGLLQKGIDEGATLSAGGPGLPENVSAGFYVKPTIFSNVKNDMAVAQEEIFGPVLCILSYKDEEDAIAIANDTPYGLAAYISGDPAHVQKITPRLRAGSIFVNGAGFDFSSPFGGYKQSGNGREFGKFGMIEFMEVKAVIGGAV